MLSVAQRNKTFRFHLASPIEFAPLIGAFTGIFRYRIARLMMACRLCAFAGILLLFIVGCRPTGSATYTVMGTVTFDGELVAEGDIVFSSFDGNGVPHAGKILNGSYQLEATSGEKRVEIHASGAEGPVDPVMNMAHRRPYIPAEYNAETKLRADVIPLGVNKVNYPLSSNPSIDPQE